jgi:hypothetical protein
MTRQEFAKAHPATRNFQQYTHTQRADMQSSHRLGFRQRESVGEAFWTHPMVPGIAFSTRSRALDRAYENYLLQEHVVEPG